MARYIDADALLNRLPDDLPYKASVKRVLMQAPTVDAVEVIRCKDCKYWGNPCEASYGECHSLDILTFPTDFCSYGERRDDDGEIH